MELRFFMEPVTPFIQLCSVISSGMVEPSCVQSAKTFFWSFMRHVPWVVVTFLVFLPIKRYYYNTFSTSSLLRDS